MQCNWKSITLLHPDKLNQPSCYVVYIDWWDYTKNLDFISWLADICNMLHISCYIFYVRMYVHLIMNTTNAKWKWRIKGILEVVFYVAVCSSISIRICKLTPAIKLREYGIKLESGNWPAIKFPINTPDRPPKAANLSSWIIIRWNQNQNESNPWLLESGNRNKVSDRLTRLTQR